MKNKSEADKLLQELLDTIKEIACELTLRAKMLYELDNTHFIKTAKDLEETLNNTKGK